MSREPEKNIEIYKLGHFEMMVIARALNVLEEVEFGNAPGYESETAKALARIFMQDGLVTIIRENEPVFLGVDYEPF